MSDTYSRHARTRVPDGDMFIHAGDFCRYGTEGEVRSFRHWLKALPHPYKVLVAGHRDWPMDDFSPHSPFVDVSRGVGVTSRLDKLFERDGIHYLRDRSVVVEGFKVYGSPWQPAMRHWAFHLPRGGRELQQKWAAIPKGTDILVTHCSPFGIGGGESTDIIGCELLREAVAARAIGLHVFGHVHESHGVRLEPMTGKTLTAFVNASICDSKLGSVQPPIVMEHSRESGWSKVC